MQQFYPCRFSASFSTLVLTFCSVVGGTHCVKLAMDIQYLSILGDDLAEPVHVADADALIHALRSSSTIPPSATLAMLCVSINR